MWEVTGQTLFRRERILPKGVIEFIFNFSDGPIPAELSSKHQNLPGCFINGFNTTVIALQLPENQLFFGVRLQPVMLKKFLKIPGSAFLNLAVDLTLIDKSFQTLWHRLSDQKTFNARVQIFLQWIHNKFTEVPPRERLINEFINAEGNHELSVDELTRSLCYSSRQVSRKIFEATGLNTEEMLSYKKYLHALSLMPQRELSLTEIAYKSSFSDQSHFIRTFRLFTALTPGVYRRNMAQPAGHIFEDVR